jgi:hypothetical protein
MPPIIQQANETNKPINPSNSNANKNQQTKFCHAGISNPFGGAAKRRPTNPIAAEMPLNANARIDRLTFTKMLVSLTIQS